jgi:hypothetical protein
MGVLLGVFMHLGAHAQASRLDSLVLSIRVTNQDSTPVYNSSLILDKRVSIRIPTSDQIIKVGIRKNSQIRISIAKEGYKDWSSTLLYGPDTLRIHALLEKLPLMLQEVGITAKRIRQIVNNKEFFVRDYGISTEGLLLYGKEDNTLLIKYYDPHLKLRDIRLLPETALEFHQDCRKQFYVLVRDKLYRLELGDKLDIALDFNENDFAKYKRGKCLFFVDSNYFFSYSNYLGSRSKFYYSCFSCDSSNLVFEFNDYVREQKLLRFRTDVYKLPIDITTTSSELSSISAEGLRGDVTYLSESNDFYNRIILRPQKWEFHYAYNHYWVMDIESLKGFKIKPNFTVSDTLSLRFIDTNTSGWSKKFFVDEEYSRLFTTYVQGDTRVVEVKGEKLEETKTVANIPFNGYFPEKLKIRGPYLYYLMFDGKKRVLYKEKMDGYE